MAKKKSKNKKRGMSWQIQIVLIFVALAGIVMMQTTMILLVGMLPTLVAFFIDRTAEKTRVLTVGAMNMAGCAPFVLQLWTTQNTMNNAFTIITDPRTIIVMYCAAGVGYIVDWAISGLVGSIMIQRGTMRRHHLAKRQADLIERWGPEVTGELPLDRYGFPIEGDLPHSSEKKKPIQ